MKNQKWKRKKRKEKSVHQRKTSFTK